MTGSAPPAVTTQGSPEPGGLWHWWRSHPLAADAAFVAGLVLVLAVPWVLVGASGSFAWSVVLLAPLVWRRRSPALVLVVVYGVAAAQWVGMASGWTTLVPGDVAVPVAAHAASAYGSTRLRRLALAGGLVGAVLAAAVPGTGQDPSAAEFVLAAVLFGLSVLTGWTLGALARGRRRELEDLRDRARLLESERDQQARLAVAAERARIARELHDVVAHSLALMIAQADGGRYAAASRPEAATTALETIGRTGREALTEMRRLLGVLREDVPDDRPDAAGEGRAGLTPQAGLADLATLVDSVRDGGVDVDLRQVGAPVALSPGAQLAAFRVVQESLTNVLKHAGPGVRAEVTLDWTTPGTLLLRVVDDGRGLPVSGGGQGLRGMAERVALYGGTVQAGPRAGGGFEVVATLRWEER